MKTIRYAVFTLITLCIAPFALADGHAGDLTLKPRQPETTMEITSIHFGEDRTSISAQGDMGAYGKVYTSYALSYDATGNSGPVRASGRGFAEGQTASGYAHGVWHRDGQKVVMQIVVMMNDGSQNLEEIITDPMTNTMTIHTYALK